MQIDLTGHHVEVTPALREYVKNKLARVERHFDRINSVHVILTVENVRRRAEAKLDVVGGQLFADAERDDMYAAIDALADKLDRQVKRHKGRLTRGRAG